MAKRPRLFVSHHSSKADVALHVEKALGVHGVDCWIAPRDVEPGEAFDDAIMRAIGGCDAVLLLFCQQSDRSPHVKRELILADSRHKAIIPLRLEQIVPDKLAYHLANSQWIDWLEQRDNALRRIADKARQLAGPVPAQDEPAPAPVPQPPPRQAQPAPPRQQFVQPPPPGKTNMGLAIGVGAAALGVLLLLVMAVAWSGTSTLEPGPAPEPTGSATPDGVAGNDPVLVPQPAPAPARSVSPSFDCANASASAELLICSDANLADMDVRLDRAYRDLLAQSGSYRSAIESDQAEWLSGTRNQCGDALCLASAMQQRLALIAQAQQLIASGAMDQIVQEMGN